MPSLKTWRGNPFQPAEGRFSAALAMINSSSIWKTGVLPPKIMLYSNNLVVGKGTVLADLTPCAFTGYAPIPTDPNLLTDANGNIMLAEPTPTSFTAGAMGTPDIAYGWAMTDQVGAVLLAVENFDTPFSFGVAGDQIDLSWRYYLPSLDPISNPGS